MTEKNRQKNCLAGVQRLCEFLIIMVRHKLPSVYKLLDMLNEVYGRIAFRGFKQALCCRVWPGIRPGEDARVLASDDVSSLMSLIQSSSEQSRVVFRPHAITDKVFRRLMNSNGYLAVGYFIGDKIVGYAFIRLYFPKKAFAGYFVADEYQRKGIGRLLFGVLKAIAKDSSLALYTYVHESNRSSLRISSHYNVEQRIPGGYLLLRHLN